MLANTDTTDESVTETFQNDNRCDRTEKSCLTVTHVPEEVFDSEKEKKMFEELFKQRGEIMSIIYLKSFSRARVIYQHENDAIQAKDELHGLTFKENQLGVYFTQIPYLPSQSATLQPPPLVKQFLISPPVSPPINWKPITEGSPIINHDLLAAVAKLQPDEPYEAHPPKDSQPSITVHWCDDEETKERPMRSLPRHLVQTRKPNS